MAINDREFPVAPTETTYHSSSQANYRAGGLNITAEYTNYGKSPTYIKTQNNIPFCIDVNKLTTSTEEKRDHLEVKMVYEIKSNDGILGTFELLNTLVATNPNLSADADALKMRLTELYSRKPSTTGKMNFCFIIYKRIIEDDIRRKKILHFKECDVVVTKEKAYMLDPHPSSNEGIQKSDMAKNKEYQGQSGVFIRVVDNYFLAKVRYYYAGKQLITVPSVVEESKESGVYCTVSTTGADGVVSPTTSFMSFEEAEEKIGLFKSQEEAISFGNPELALKAEEARQRAEEIRGKAEERRLARELVEVKHRADMEAANAERELAEVRRAAERIKAENAELKDSIELRRTVRDDSYDHVKKTREINYDSKRRYEEDFYDTRERQRRDYYDNRSYERKDTSELIKFVPGLIVGVLGAFAIFGTMNSKKSSFA